MLSATGHFEPQSLGLVKIASLVITKNDIAVLNDDDVLDFRTDEVTLNRLSNTCFSADSA